MGNRSLISSVFHLLLKKAVTEPIVNRKFRDCFAGIRGSGLEGGSGNRIARNDTHGDLCFNLNRTEMTERWFAIALIVSLLWGSGSFFGKMALARDIPYRVYLFEGIGTLIVLTFLIVSKRQEIFTGFSFNVFGLLMGLSWGIGTILFIIALQPAKLSVIVPLTAIYPAFTVLLSFLFLQERLELREIVGIALAVISVVLLAK